MPDFGNPVIKFGSLILDASKCIQVSNFTGNTLQTQYWCDGVQKTIFREAAHQLTFSIAIPKDDVATRQALLMGLSDTAEYLPSGENSGEAKYSTTNATIQTHVAPADPANLMTLDITMAWDGVTLEAVTP